MMHSGVIINYAESVDTVAADMERWRPTLMASVPRLYEKIYGRVLDAVRAGSAVKRRIFFWGKRVGETVVERRLGNRPLSPLLRAQLRAGRPAGVLQAAGPHRRPDPVLHLGRRAALGRHRPVLPRRGHADPRGLRTHRDVTGDRGEHLRAAPARHGGPADPGGRGEDRAGRGDPHPGAPRHDRLLQEAAGHRRGARRRGVVPHRRHRRCWTRTGSSGSPTARRTSSSPPAARTFRPSRSRRWPRPTSSSPARSCWATGGRSPSC